MRGHRRFLSVCIGGLVVLASFVVWIESTTLDGLQGLFALVWRENTKYSVGYTDAGFSDVHVGQTKDQVRKALGDPIEIRTDPYATRGVAKECWAFTTSPGNTNYRLRLVCFDDADRVLWTEASFWAD
ncbi:MAG: hypothetical protein AAF517_12740 [Planctomycetota bacterium]